MDAYVAKSRSKHRRTRFSVHTALFKSKPLSNFPSPSAPALQIAVDAYDEPEIRVSRVS